MKITICPLCPKSFWDVKVGTWSGNCNTISSLHYHVNDPPFGRLREHELFYVTVTLASVGCSSDTLLQVKHLDSEARIRASSDRWSGLQNTGAAWQTWAPPVKQDKTCSTDLIRHVGLE